MYGDMKAHLRAELKAIQADGLFKKERIISSVQDAVIRLEDGSEVLNFCANNYLGLSSHPRVVEAAKKAIDDRGFGMSSVRFICGTQDIHKELEAQGVICDTREPVVMRIAPTPMYNSFNDVFTFVQMLKEILVK